MLILASRTKRMVYSRAARGQKVAYYIVFKEFNVPIKSTAELYLIF